MWVCICKNFLKNVIEEWFSSNAFVYMFKEYSLVYHRRRQAFTKMFVHIVHMLQLRPCFFLFFFYKQFVLPRTKLIWIFSSYRICQIRNIQLQDNTFQSISFINMADSMKIILTLLALMCQIN